MHLISYNIYGEDRFREFYSENSSHPITKKQISKIKDEIIHEYDGQLYDKNRPLDHDSVSIIGITQIWR